MKKLNILLALLLILSYVLAPFTSMAEGGFEDWKNTPTQVAKDKVWSVRLSQPVNPSSVNPDNVFVEDESGAKIANQLSVEENNTLIKVQPPTGGYEAGRRYTLYIKDLRGADGALLKQDIRMTFFVKGEVEVAEYKVATGVVTLDQDRDRVRILEEGDKIVLPKDVLTAKGIAVDGLVLVLPNATDLYGTSGKVVNLSERDGQVTLTLEEVPFFEIISKMEIKGSMDEFHVNPRFQNMDGVSVETYKNVIDGEEFQHFDFNFEDTSVFVNEEKGVLFEDEVSPDWEKEFEKGILTGKITIDIPKIETDITYENGKKIRRIKDFKTFQIEFNPKFSLDLTLKMAKGFNKKYQPELNQFELLDIPAVGPIAFGVSVQPDLKFSYDVSASGELVTHFSTGVSMGVEKSGKGLAGYCRSSGSDFYLDPKVEVNTKADMEVGLHIKLDMHIGKAKKKGKSEYGFKGSLGIDNHVGIHGDANLNITAKDDYQVNDEGDKEWMNGSYGVNLFYRPSLFVGATLLKWGWEKEYPITEIKKQILNGSIQGLNRLTDAEFEKKAYDIGKDTHVKATATYQRYLIMENNGKSTSKRIGNPYKINILPFEKGKNLTYVKDYRKIVLNPKKIVEIKEEDGKIRVLKAQDREVALAVNFFDKTATTLLKVHGNQPIPPDDPEEPDYPPESEWTDAKWFYFDAGARMITGYLNEGPKDVVIPKEINGTPVTKIKRWAFEYKGLTSVKIPDEVSIIGEEAFKGNQLSHITLPRDLTELWSEAFSYNQLQSVKLNPGLRVIYQEAFRGNKITKLDIPDSVQRIGGWAFYQNQLAEVHIPKSVVKIGEGAFAQNQLTRLHLPDSVLEIGGSAFSENRLESVRLSLKLKALPEYAFWRNRIRSLEIPEKVTYVGKSCFENNEISDLRLPDGLKEIDNSAFRVNQLRTIYIPDPVTRLGEHTFRDNGLTEVEIPKNCSYYHGVSWQTFDSYVKVKRRP